VVIGEIVSSKGSGCVVIPGRGSHIKVEKGFVLSIDWKFGKVSSVLMRGRWEWMVKG
jgi:hypothetical protein